MREDLYILGHYGGPFWLETKKFEKYVKSFSACKSQHGGLGAFYVKLKLKV